MAKQTTFILIAGKVFFPLSDKYLVYLCDKDVFDILTVEEVESHIEAIIKGMLLVEPTHTIH